MPPTKMSVKLSSSATVSNNKSERLVLSEHIAKCTSTMEKFLEATQQFQDYRTEIFADLDRQIESKTKEHEDYSQKINREEEEARITTQQRIKEFKRNAALQILEETHEVPIIEQELTDIRNELAELRTNKQKAIDEAVNQIKADEQKALKIAIQNMKLTHEAEIATIKAVADQKDKEVEVLRTTITDMKHELAEQRELTKSVASSLKSGAITLNAGKP